MTADADDLELLDADGLARHHARRQVAAALADLRAARRAGNPHAITFATAAVRAALEAYDRTTPEPFRGPIGGRR